MQRPRRPPATWPLLLVGLLAACVLVGPGTVGTMWQLQGKGRKRGRTVPPLYLAPAKQAAQPGSCSLTRAL